MQLRRRAILWYTIGECAFGVTDVVRHYLQSSSLSVMQRALFTRLHDRHAVFTRARRT